MSYNILYGVWIRNERELKLMNLEELNLKGNVFNSSILSSLGSLSNLKSLSLSHIYAMEGLTVTYTVMGLPALKNLEKLRLGCVFGSGWQNLTSLEELTLTDSSFTSNIVQDIGTLTALKNLVIDTCVVDDNLDLHTGQISTFEESSYVGNPLLCGEPLPKNCSTDGSSSSMPKNATEEGSIDMKVFYASFVGSYIVMPLCIAIMLYINPYWRRAWFYHVEAATMSCYYFVLDNILPKRFYEGTI
ncbi:hypothetical protein GOBAR_DD34902 [Gossypium barbadense]|nr:hypothetical protein GOBAR_DD34902 [Gossypium barbadense]